MIEMMTVMAVAMVVEAMAEGEEVTEEEAAAAATVDVVAAALEEGEEAVLGRDGELKMKDDALS